MKIIPTKDGSFTIYNESLNAHYHSLHGAIQESKHIFIKNGLEQIKDDKISIFEMGFGSGLNAFLSFLTAQKNKAFISYYCIEKHPIPKTIYQKLNYSKNKKESEMFLNLHEAPWNKEVSLSPFFKLKKNNESIAFFDTTAIPKVNIIYYDAFAPSAQPYLWEVPILKKMYTLLKPKGMLLTFCAKGSVKRNLKAVGFIIKPLPGPPGKREITCAIKLPKLYL